VLAGEIYAPKKIRLIEVPESQLDGSSGQIVFQPELGCLCASDFLFYEADYPEYPPVVGHSLHELIGSVVKSNGTRFDVGDRVLCVPENQAGLFERFCVADDRAIPLDDRPAPEHALMAQPLGTVIYALRKLPNLIDKNVAVVGQGPIGQLFCGALRNLGAREIIAIDPVESRLKISPSMGATAVVNNERDDPTEAIRTITGGAMADLVIEAVGHREQAFNLCVSLCRDFGQILVFGVPTKIVDGLHWQSVMVKNISVQTSINPDFSKDFPLAMRWIAEQRIDVSPIVTHRFELQDIQTAFETFHQRRDGALKVLVDFPVR